jgi:hypothetical protein
LRSTFRTPESLYARAVRTIAGFDTVTLRDVVLVAPSSSVTVSVTV